MVSVKLSSLPREYIEAAKQLVNELDESVKYAFFFLRYDEDQEWYDGSWWLLIASDEFEHDSNGVRIVLDLIKQLNINLDEFDFIIEKPDEDHKRIYDRVDIKALY